MDLAIAFMEFSIMIKWPVYKEELFRTPLASERAIGLWVDRIGSGMEAAKPSRLRQLGQYATVHVDTGKGIFYSPATGELDVRPRQVMVLFPDEPNMYYSDTKWTSKWIVWNGPDAAMLERLGYLRREHSVLPDRTGAVDRAFARLTRIMASEDIATVLERKTIVLDMVLELFKGTCEARGRRNPDTRMDGVIAFLAAHCTDELPVGQVARQFNLSVPHFRRLFKQHTGRSPRAFVTSLRISKAKELLSQGMSIKETSARVGYDDLFYFMRVFKQTTDVSPGKFL
jgi:AraC-like DNA-binding protein